LRYNLVPTSDGSFTLFDTLLKDHFHSTHGAIEEAKHVFIKNGLNVLSEKKKIRLFELGFGTGLNAFLTSLNRPKYQHIDYFSIDKYPLPVIQLKSLNYAESFGEAAKVTLNKYRLSDWNEAVSMDGFFNLHKIHGDILTEDIPTDLDLIYFDAFCPRAQPELWSKTVLNKCLSNLKSGGVFVTYAANGQLKRSIKDLGYRLEVLPGPMGKREMVRAFG